LRSNRDTIAALTGVAVHTLPQVTVEVAALAAAGAAWPVADWLS
jgi:hypothetical protein